MRVPAIAALFTASAAMTAVNVGAAAPGAAAGAAGAQAGARPGAAAGAGEGGALAPETPATAAGPAPATPGSATTTSTPNATEASAGPYLYSQQQLATLAPHARQRLSWALQKSYEGYTFFDEFQFFSEADPSHGMVNYVDHDTAFRTGLAFWTADGTPGIQAEHWKTFAPASGAKRDSVRISSTALYGGGLFVVDMRLVPWGCAVWPAVWLLGYEKTWPYAGEIDIIEGVQEANRNQMTVHTSPGCTIAPDTGYTGQLVDANCDSTTDGSGCAIISDSTMSYGKDFNANGGGVFVALWDGDGIKIWNWARGAVPHDITYGSPQPLTWGPPVAAFGRSTCDPYVYFKPATIILNVNLCGDWAGSTYSRTCADRIANPANLGETVMLINSIKIYQQTDAYVPMASAYTVSNLTGVGGHAPRVGRGGAGSGGRGGNAASRRASLVGGVVALVALIAVAVVFW